MNSLARSNASLYGNKEELYDRLRRHAYNGKKGKVTFIVICIQPVKKSSLTPRNLGVKLRSLKGRQCLLSSIINNNLMNFSMFRKEQDQRR